MSFQNATIEIRQLKAKRKRRADYLKLIEQSDELETSASQSTRAAAAATDAGEYETAEELLDDAAEAIYEAAALRRQAAKLMGGDL